MMAVTAADPDAPPDIAEVAASAEVVIFRSGLTDTRRVIAWLEDRGSDYRVVTMGMGDPRERDRFHRLRDWTGWELLPAVFVHGTFVGGADELLERAAAGTLPGSPGT